MADRVPRARVVAQLALAAAPGSPELVATMAETTTFQGRLVVSNKSAAARTYRLYIVPDGESIGDTSQIAWDILINAVPHVREIELGPGDRLYARMGTGSNEDITVTLMGTETEI